MFKREHKQDWHLRDEVTLATAREYFDFLRALFADRPDLVRRLAHCADCSMPFLADPRNRRRTDLRCPFGCQTAHRKEGSAARSAAYYRSPDGRKMKQEQNMKRSTRARAVGPDLSAPNAAKTKALLAYLCLAISLIERRWVHAEEIESVLNEFWRQRGISLNETIGYFENRVLHKPP